MKDLEETDDALRMSRTKTFLALVEALLSMGFNIALIQYVSD